MVRTYYIVGIGKQSHKSLLFQVAGRIKDCHTSGLADVSYDKWLKYSAPLMGIYAVISIAVVAFLASVGYVG